MPWSSRRLGHEMYAPWVPWPLAAMNARPVPIACPTPGCHPQTRLWVPAAPYAINKKMPGRLALGPAGPMASTTDAVVLIIKLSAHFLKDSRPNRSFSPHRPNNSRPPKAVKRHPDLPIRLPTTPDHPKPPKAAPNPHLCPLQPPLIKFFKENFLLPAQEIGRASCRERV